MFISDKMSTENNKMITDISDRIWLTLNLFRGEISTEDYHFILFLLYKRKNSTINDIIGDGINFDDLFKIKFDNSNEFSFQKKKSPEQIIEDYYASIIKEIPVAKLQEIVSSINTIDGRFFEANFIELFDALLYKYFNSLGRYSGESLLPKEISRFMINLANLKPNSSIYNPFAGPASLGVLAIKENIYVGQEINVKTRIIGMLRLLITNSFDTKNLLSSDSIDNWNPSNDKFDLIITSPPFVSRLPFDISGKWGTIRNFESFTIEKGLESLKQDGKLIIHVPDSFLFSSGQVANLRYHLIEEDLIESVISFPNDLLHHTAIKTSILVINKAKKSKGFINFIIADEFVNNGTNRTKTLQDLDFFNAISQGKDNAFIKKVSIEEVYSNSRVLNCNRYFINKIEGTKLLDIIEPITGQRSNLPENGKLVRFRDLKDDNLDFHLDYDKVEEIALNRPNIHQIQESCFLMALTSKTLKPTYFDFNDNPIFTTLDIFSAKIRESKVDQVDIAYLISELQSEYVQKQLDSFRLGATIPFVRRDDLLEVVVKLPSIEEQKAKVSGIIELFSKLRELEAEKDNLLKGIKKEETESSTSLSHILGKPLLSIGSSLEIIQNTLSNIYPKWKEILISETKQFYMIDAFESISKNVKYIQELTDENTALVNVSSFNLTEINLMKFLSEFVKNEKKSLKNNIELKLDIHKDLIEQMNNKIFIFGNEQKLKIVLINLIDNAKNHAFINIDMENKINIEILPFTRSEREASLLNYDITGQKSYIEVKVSNTGKPFPKDFTLEDYTRKNFAVGKTRNKGLGGYEVNEIIKAHNEGKKALNISSLEENQNYSSTVSFLIPII